MAEGCTETVGTAEGAAEGSSDRVGSFEGAAEGFSDRVGAREGAAEGSWALAVCASNIECSNRVITARVMTDDEATVRFVFVIGKIRRFHNNLLAYCCRKTEREQRIYTNESQ